MKKRELILGVWLLFAFFTDVPLTVFAEFKGTEISFSVKTNRRNQYQKTPFPILFLGDAARSLLQEVEGEILISSKEARLEQAIKGAKKGDTILITTPEVVLGEQLVISVANLHIKGNSKRDRPTIRCVSDSARIEVK